MGCDGAFWLYDENDDEWKFHLVTPLIESMGSREIYLQLDKALARILSEPEFDDVAIYIVSPPDPLITSLRKKIRTLRSATVPQFVSVDLDGTPTDAVVYRLADIGATYDPSKNEQLFRKLSDEVAAA